MKLLILTDPHLLESGGEIIGLDPSARFAHVLEHAVTHHPDADHIVILGDLTHHGRAAQYAQLVSLLRDVQIPVSFMLGNHDNRAEFIRAFPMAPLSASGHVQQVINLGTHRLICLDTLDDQAQPPDSGILCRDRLQWLRGALDTAQGAPVILALHHPPFKTGFDGMDAIKLRNDAEFYELITQYPNVVQLLCGHIHRTISGSAHGVPFAVFKSTCHQMPMKLGVIGSGHSVDEPGAYGIILLSQDGVIIHSEDAGLNAHHYESSHSA